MSGPPKNQRPCRACGTMYLPTNGRQVFCSAWCRFWSYVDGEGDCYEWTGSRNVSGYGKFKAGNTSRLAHHWLWTEFVGPVPDGHDLDHLCRNRRCVNIAHLQPVTHRENMVRGLAGAWQRAKTRCPYGHEYIEVNWARGRGRRCKTCSNERARLYQQRKRREARDGQRTA